MTSETWQQRINIDPAIQAGRPVIAGTRVTLDVILASLAGGMAVEQIADDYEITPEDVRAAVAYAAYVLANKRVYALPSG